MRVAFAIRATVLTGLTVCLVVPPAAAQPPPPPPRTPAVPMIPPRDPARRPPPDPVGTAVIRGRVVTSDTGNPVRRANVNLLPVATPSAPPPSTGVTTMSVQMVNGVPIQMGGRQKTVTTDAQGAFEFAALPAGSYRLSASAGQYSAGYLGIAYGAKKPNAPGSSDPGTIIQLGEGQAFDKAVIALPRGGVITGRVTDENGEALARVQVFTMFYMPGAARGQRMGGASTDDLGQFRLFGLAPGEYTVLAEARGNTFVQPNAPPESEEDKIGFMTTYYPGTADEGGAARVRARAGAETPGVEIRMVTGRLFHVSGMVTDSQGRPAARTSGNLFRPMTGGFGLPSFGFSTDEQGRFQMRNIPPGNYRLGVQQRPVQFSPDGSRSEPGEMASVQLAIASDVDNLMIVTSPGATITGQIQFEQGAPAPAATLGIRVNASPGSPDNMQGMQPPQPAVVTPDMTFTMKGMMGEFVLRASAPNQHLKAVMLGAEDITDNPREFKTGEKVTLVLTSRASTLEGSVTDAAGKPVTDGGLLIFSEDKASWRMNSSKTRRSGVMPDGRYRVTGLMPGRYFAAAVTRDRLNVPSAMLDTAFFEQLAKEATSFVIGEDEQRVVDLKVIASEGGL